MKKEAFAFHMEAYSFQNPKLKQIPPCLVLSQPSGFDLNRYFPAQWRYKSYSNAQRNLPGICSDALLIQTSMRNAECSQQVFVQNYIRQSKEYQEKNAQEFARDLRKNLSIRNLSNLLFSNFEIFVLKCGCMDGFPQAKKEETPMERWIKSNGASLDLEIVEADEKLLSPYETDFIGFFVIPRRKNLEYVTLSLLKNEFEALNDYHRKNYIFSTKHL